MYATAGFFGIPDHQRQGRENLLGFAALYWILEPYAVDNISLADLMFSRPRKFWVGWGVPRSISKHPHHPFHYSERPSNDVDVVEV